MSISMMYSLVYLFRMFNKFSDQNSMLVPRFVFMQLFCLEKLSCTNYIRKKLKVDSLQNN